MEHLVTNKKEQDHQGHALLLVVGDKQYVWHEQYITGLQIKQLGGLPEDSELYLTIRKPWKDELITNERSVDLAMPHIESFYEKKPLEFTVNGQVYKSNKQYITGAEIRHIAGLGDNAELVLVIEKPWENEIIEDDTRVDLARPGIEHFVTSSVCIAIIVNGRPKTWEKRKIGFEEVVALAGGNTGDAGKAYTVTYLKGPQQNPEGEMGRGDVVFIKNKMIFNATPTDKS